jgi:uncharacterized protein (TIRG00374 family)
MPASPGPAAPEEDGAAAALPARRGRPLPWIKLLVSLGCYALIFYGTDIGTILRHLREARLEFVAGGVLLYAAGQALSTYRWQLLLRPVGLTVPFVHLLGFYFTGMFFNLFLPTIVGGDAVKALLLARETGAPARATMSVFMERNLGLLALLTIATVAAPIAPPVVVGGLPLTAICPLLFAGYLAVNAVIANPRAYSMVDRLIAMSPLAGARMRAASLYEAVAQYRRHVRALAVTLCLSFVFQFVVVGVVFLNARALDLDVPLSALAVFVPLIALAGMIPVTVNGLGVREALYILLFGQLGAPTELAVSLALLFLAVTFVASLPGGLVYTFHRSPSTIARSRSAADDAAMRRS